MPSRQTVRDIAMNPESPLDRQIISGVGRRSAWRTNRPCDRSRSSPRRKSATTRLLDALGDGLQERGPNHPHAARALHQGSDDDARRFKPPNLQQCSKASRAWVSFSRISSSPFQVSGRNAVDPKQHRLEGVEEPELAPADMAPTVSP